MLETWVTKKSYKYGYRTQEYFPCPFRGAAFKKSVPHFSSKKLTFKTRLAFTIVATISIYTISFGWTIICYWRLAFIYVYTVAAGFYKNELILETLKMTVHSGSNYYIKVSVDIYFFLIKITLTILKVLRITDLGDFWALECVFMPKIGPKVTKVGPKNTKIGLFM